jgi:hypothetical protein
MPNSPRKQFIPHAPEDGTIEEDFDPVSMDEFAAFMIEALTIPYPIDAGASAASAIGAGTTSKKPDQSQ